MDSMFASLLMDRQALVKHLPWKELKVLGGVNYRILEELFRIIKEREGMFSYEVTASALEVYNEQIHDLLLAGSQPGTTTKR